MYVVVVAPRLTSLVLGLPSSYVTVAISPSAVVTVSLDFVVPSASYSVSVRLPSLSTTVLSVKTLSGLRCWVVVVPFSSVETISSLLSALIVSILLSLLYLIETCFCPSFSVTETSTTSSVLLLKSWRSWSNSCLSFLFKPFDSKNLFASFLEITLSPLASNADWKPFNSSLSNTPLPSLSAALNIDFWVSVFKSWDFNPALNDERSTPEFLPNFPTFMSDKRLILIW